MPRKDVECERSGFGRRHGMYVKLDT
jgi:hypothetical protein